MYRYRVKMPIADTNAESEFAPEGDSCHLLSRNEFEAGLACFLPENEPEGDSCHIPSNSSLLSLIHLYLFLEDFPGLPYELADVFPVRENLLLLEVKGLPFLDNLAHLFQVLENF